MVSMLAFPASTHIGIHRWFGNISDEFFHIIIISRINTVHSTPHAFKGIMRLHKTDFLIICKTKKQRNKLSDLILLR